MRRILPFLEFLFVGARLQLALFGGWYIAPRQARPRMLAEVKFDPADHFAAITCANCASRSFIATPQVPRHRAIFDSKLTACPLSVPFFLNKKATDDARS